MPPMRTAPCVTGARPAIRLSSTVLPTPLGPVRATCSPAATCRSRSLNSGWAPGWAKVMPRNPTAWACMACMAWTGAAWALAACVACPTSAATSSAPGSGTPCCAIASSAFSAASPAARSCQTADNSRSGSKKLGASSSTNSPSPSVSCRPQLPNSNVPSRWKPMYTATIATPSAENSSSTADDKKAMRKTAMVRACSARALCRSRRAVASTAPSARSVARPRSLSSKKACMSPRAPSCAWLAACARQPTRAMKIGISGAATSSTSAAAHEHQATAGSRTSGTATQRQRAVG